MAVPLRELEDRSPAELPVGTPVRLRIRAVLVTHPRTGQEVRLDGAVDFAAWDSCVFALTDPATGLSKVVPGLCLLVEDPAGGAGEKRLNVVSKRLIAQLRPFLESGRYRELAFTVTKTEERPRSTFTVVPEPLG